MYIQHNAIVYNCLTKLDKQKILKAIYQIFLIKTILQKHNFFKWKIPYFKDPSIETQLKKSFILQNQKEFTSLFDIHNGDKYIN